MPRIYFSSCWHVHISKELIAAINALVDTTVTDPVQEADLYSLPTDLISRSANQIGDHAGDRKSAYSFCGKQYRKVILGCFLDWDYFRVMNPFTKFDCDIYTVLRWVQEDKLIVQWLIDIYDKDIMATGNSHSPSKFHDGSKWMHTRKRQELVVVFTSNFCVDLPEDFATELQSRGIWTVLRLVQARYFL